STCDARSGFGQCDRAQAELRPTVGSPEHPSSQPGQGDTMSRKGEYTGYQNENPSDHRDPRNDDGNVMHSCSLDTASSSSRLTSGTLLTYGQLRASRHTTAAPGSDGDVPVQTATTMTMPSSPTKSSGLRV